MIGLYCRVSTTMQEEGYSLEIQEAEGIRYSTSRGEPYKVYKDVVSGTSSRRLDRIKKDIENKKIDTLWVINIDRLTRLPPAAAFDFRDYLLHHQIRIIERDHDFDIKSLLNYGFNAIVNYDFIERLQTKVLEGKCAQRNAGRQTYSSLFGYEQRIVGSGKNGKALREWDINPDKAKVVQLIFQLNTRDRLGLAEICKRLNGMGYKSERGKNFEPSAISRILAHIEYTGRSVDREGKIIEGQIYAPIIDFATWEAAQDSYVPTITNNSKRGRIASHAMTNILHCEYCGAGFYYHSGIAPYKWKHEDKTTIRHREVYYHRHVVPCKNTRKTFSMENLDAIGLIVYRRAMTQSSAELLKDVMSDIRSRLDDEKTFIENTRNDIRKKEMEIKRFEDAIAMGLDTSTAIVNINKRNAEIAELKRRIEETEQKGQEERKAYEAMMAEFSLDNVRKYLKATSRIRLGMLKRILKEATTKNGALKFTLIDNRTFRFDYEAMQAEFKQIARYAKAAVQAIPTKKEWGESLEGLIQSLDQSWAVDAATQSVFSQLEGKDIFIEPEIWKRRSKGKGLTLDGWERAYLIDSYVFESLE